jgi:membrane AbrB-like protein
MNARGLVVTAVAALAGGAALGLSGVPAGWLSGAMMGVAAAAAFGAAAPPPKPVQHVTILLSGVAMGSGLSPQTLHTLARYPLSLAILAVGIVAMTAASYSALLRSHGFNRPTAFYGAVPGALSYVFLVADGSGADLARVAVIQVFRLFVLMAIVPLVARVGAGAAIAVFATDPLYVTAILVGLAGATGFALEAAGVANGGLYAGILVSAAAHGAGWAPGRLQPDLQIVAQVLVGAWVGARFIGFDWGLLRRLLLAAAGSFLAAFAVAAAFAALAARAVGAPFADALAAFAPGGLEAMTMMAFALGLDPLFVGAHHLARFLFISVTLPFAAGRFAR